MRRLSAAIGRPVSFALSQHDLAPDQWQRRPACSPQEANADGADLRGQVGGRPLNLLIGFQTFHPFLGRPDLREDRPPAARRAHRRAAAPRDPGGDPRRDARPASPLDAVIGTNLDVLFPIGEPPDYEPAPTGASPPSPHARARPAKRCSTT